MVTLFWASMPVEACLFLRFSSLLHISLAIFFLFVFSFWVKWYLFEGCSICFMWWISFLHSTSISASVFLIWDSIFKNQILKYMEIGEIP